jgi:hypothetical protein
MRTLEQSIKMAKDIAIYSKQSGIPTAMEVVKTRPNVDGEIYNVQPFGMHCLFKSHKLMHVEPIPDAASVTENI